MRNPIGADLPHEVRLGKYRVGALPWPRSPRADGSCGLCADQPGPDYCCHCDRTAPKVERDADADMIADAGRELAAECRRQARIDAEAARPLDERARREMWNGYEGGVRFERHALDTQTLAYRELLRSLGMAPDWSKDLPRDGRSVRAQTNVTRFDTADRAAG